MKTTSSQLSEKIFNLGQSYIEAYQNKHMHLPVIESDESWPSPCIQGPWEDTFDLWQPVRLESVGLNTEAGFNFENVEHALTLTIHQDIKTYFTTMFSDALPMNSNDGQLFLLFPWSESDFERLQENIIGHIIMKRKLKQEVTIFFAVTDQDDFMLSIKNTTGEVWVERVGCEPHKKLANNLLEFIESITPAL